MLRRTGLTRVFLMLLMLILGMMIVAQFRARGRLRAVSALRDQQIVLLSELADANLQLRTAIDRLQVQEAEYSRSDRAPGLEELVAELNRVKILNGLVEVSGPGMEIILDGPLNALDLQDMANELRNAGAEAIALNGHRLAISSVVVADLVGDLSVDSQRLERPYRFQAIGDPDTLETAVLRGGGLVALLRQGYPGLQVQSTVQSRLVLGVRRVLMGVQYAQPVE